MDRTSRHTLWNLVILAEIIFVVKTVITLFRKIPTILPDEVCVIQRAMHFGQTLKIDTCEAISGLPGGNPHPFYSMVISPAYRLFHGLYAYHAALIINAFLVATLVFPLYGILRRFVSNTKAIFASIFLILFSAQLVVFDSTVMTETIFIVVNVWFTYFYLKSFEEHRWRYKGLAALFAVFAALSRPFGFIVLVAMLVNEALQLKGKEKKILLPILAVLAVAFTAVTLVYINPDMIPKLWGYVQSLSQPNGLKNVAIAIIEQINSFSLATFLIPLIVFFAYIGSKDSPHLNAIRWYILVYLLLNFLISAQHIYGYLVAGDDPGLLTRYINSSLIYIFIFSFAFFFRYQRFEFTKKTASIAALFIILLLFLPSGFKHSLNPDLSMYGDIWTHLFGKDITPVNNLLKYYFLPASFLLFLLLVLGKRTLLALILGVAMIVNASFLVLYIVPQGVVPTYISYFSDKESHISAIITPEQTQSVREYHDALWLILGTSRNKMHPILVDFKNSARKEMVLNLEQFKNSEFFNTSPYILSQYYLDLPIILGWGDVIFYANPNAR